MNYFLVNWVFFDLVTAGLYAALIFHKRLSFSFVFYILIYVQNCIHVNLTRLFGYWYHNNMELFHYQNAIICSCSLFFIASQITAINVKKTIYLFVVALLIFDFFIWKTGRYAYPVYSESISLIVTLICCLIYFVELFISEKEKNIHTSMPFWAVSAILIVSCGFFWVVLNDDDLNTELSDFLWNFGLFVNFFVSVFLFAMTLAQFFIKPKTTI